MKKNKSHSVSILQRARFILMFVVFVFVFAAYFGRGIHPVLASSVRSLRDLDSSYGEKMTRRWGWYYDFISFIKENTPEDANIVFPPQSNQYPRIGNLGLNSYFLLPRSLYHGNEQTVQGWPPRSI